MTTARGDFIGGSWVLPEGPTYVRSVDPSTAGDEVFRAPSDPAHAAAAVAAAAEAGRSWAKRSPAERAAALRRFAKELSARQEELARAITREIGKTLAESRAEAASLAMRVEEALRDQVPQTSPWTAPEVPGECRSHPLGPIAVLGPYNFPLHLLHGHVVPALLAGSTAVVKPSERTPLSAQIYAECFEAARIPPVLQLVQGGPDVGRALLDAPELRGLAFTGSYRAGRAIAEVLSGRPDVLCALEMGGQNMAIVLDDADLERAVSELLVGAYLTTGQRCTCTQRVLATPGIAGRLAERLAAAAGKLTWGDPETDVFMGPLAALSDRDRVDALCHAAVEAGAEVLVPAERRSPGAFRGPSLHRIDAGHDSPYTREEVFGPDLALSEVRDLDHALALVRESPYALSASVFTPRREPLERLFHETRVGCANWNRSTNRASGRFPFGGTGRSGNYRPAGAWAIRNSVFPVQFLWPDDRDEALERLELRHRLEEVAEPYGVYPDFAPDHAGACEVTVTEPDLDGVMGATLAAALAKELSDRGVPARHEDGAVRFRLPADPRALSDALHAIRPLHPARFLGRRLPGAHVPKGESLSLPRSERFLARLVAGGFVPDDKKPPVLDLYRSSGPYLASVDDDPLVLLDAGGQIGTHAGGLNPPEVLESLWVGEFGTLPLEDAGPEAAVLDWLGSSLRRGCRQTLPYIAFTGSGAEANELAIREAARLRPGRRALVAFEGAFHGRTVLALHATWNPSKRARFVLDTEDVRFVPWPTYDRSRPADDPDLLRREDESIARFKETLADDQVVLVLVEPMQAEGGERHATSRFMRRLRKAALEAGVPVCFDEVQTGVGLGGPFFWHLRFDLQEPPDFVTVAKKAQVGAVLSRHPLTVHRHEPHAASALRGALQASIVLSHPSEPTTNHVKRRLAELSRRHPKTLLSPRVEGWAFGFDLPSPEALQHLLDQRLWRGWMLYGAGDRALRFRLHSHMGEEAIDAIFDRLDESLALLESGAGPGWREEEPLDLAPPWPPVPARVAEGYRIVRIRAEDWDRIAPHATALQEAVYEPARRDDMRRFGGLATAPGAICLAAVEGTGLPPDGELVGTAFAFPVEHFPGVDGPADGAMFGRGVNLYSADVTVHPAYQGLGLGVALKEAQVREAMLEKRADGTPRYLCITGRNRLGLTAAMRLINGRFGAWEVDRYEGQYGDPTGVAVYYRIPLTTPRLPPHAVPRPAPPAVLDLSDGLRRPLRLHGEAAAPILESYARGALSGAVVNKLSLCNFVTPGYVRAMEWLRATAPRGLAHVVPSSSRAETADKGLRALKFHRPLGAVAISVGPVDAGETTAAARSLSFAPDHPESWFRWPRTADPTLDPDRALADLEAAIAAAGADRVLGVVVEAVYARTGRAVPDSFWSPLRALLDRHGVPLVLLETATAGYRTGRGLWRADTLPVPVDAVWWYPGAGQQGLVFLSDRLNVAEKLTLISTWDGDELSLVRLVWQLRAARRLPVEPTAHRLAELLRRLGPVSGEGLYRSVACPNAPGMLDRLLAAGVRAGLTSEGDLLFAPPLDLGYADLDLLDRAIESVLEPAP